jgi:hypothetical protein
MRDVRPSESQRSPLDGKIKVLTGMSRFVIADVTDSRAAPLELQATVPDYMVPFVPILHEGEQPFSMLVDLQKYE